MRFISAVRKPRIRASSSSSTVDSSMEPAISSSVISSVSTITARLRLRIRAEIAYTSAPSSVAMVMGISGSTSAPSSIMAQ